MFKKDSSYKDGFDTLVGINSVFEGNIESDGTVRVDGKVKGDIRVKGDVYVGDNAVVSGSIFANNVHLSGTVEGNIHSTGVLRILSTAKLYGDIQVRSFVTDEGALFQGKCSMIDVPEPDKTLEKPGVKKGSKEYKKSSVLDQIYDEKEKNMELKED